MFALWSSSNHIPMKYRRPIEKTCHYLNRVSKQAFSCKSIMPGYYCAHVANFGWLCTQDQSLARFERLLDINKHLQLDSSLEQWVTNTIYGSWGWLPNFGPFQRPPLGLLPQDEANKIGIGVLVLWHDIGDCSILLWSCYTKCHFSGGALPLIFCIHVHSGPIYWKGVINLAKRITRDGNLHVKNLKILYVMVFYM